MPNNIPKKQNEAFQIAQLQAQRKLYSRVKVLTGVQIALAIVVPVLGTVVDLFMPVFRGVLALYGIIISVVDLAVVEAWKTRLRTLAARIQEEFDCAVLELPWDSIGVGAHPETEDLLAMSRAEKKVMPSCEIGILRFSVS